MLMLKMSSKEQVTEYRVDENCVAIHIFVNS